MVTFSVIIPSYNYAETLPTTLASVLNQGRDDIEIIVVDDASTDATPELIHEYGASVRYLRNQTNLGPAGAWGVGIELARGEYITKLDADDWILPGFFDRIESSFDDAIGMVIGSVYDYREDLGTATVRPVADRDVLLDSSEFRQRLLHHFFFRMPGTVLRRSAVAAVGPPDARLWLPHDWEFFLRATRGWGCALIRDPIAVYRLHGRSLTGTSRVRPTLRPDVERFLALVRDPNYEGFLDSAERNTFVQGLAEIYLRIVGANLAPTQVVSSLAHLWYAMRLAASETPRLALPVAAFGISSAISKLTCSLSGASEPSVPIESLLPIPRDQAPPR